MMSPRSFELICFLLLLKLSIGGFSLAEGQHAGEQSWQLGQVKLRKGDSLHITQVCYTQDSIWVSGTYELDSERSAELSLMVEAEQPPDNASKMNLHQGKGEFNLSHAWPSAGLPHLVFSLASDPFGEPMPKDTAFGWFYFGDSDQAEASKKLVIPEPPPSDYSYSRYKDAEVRVIAHTRKRMAEIILPQIELSGMKLDEAAAHFYWTASNAAGGGFKIMISGQHDDEAADNLRVNLWLKQVPLGKVMEYAAMQTRHRLVLNGFAAVFEPDLSAGSPDPVKWKHGQAKVHAEQLRSPQIHWQAVPVDHALEFLRVFCLSAEDAPDKVSNFVLLPGGDLSRTVTLDSKDCSVWDAVSELAQQTGYHLLADDHALLLLPQKRKGKATHE